MLKLMLMTVGACLVWGTMAAICDMPLFYTILESLGVGLMCLATTFTKKMNDACHRLNQAH